jgi:hypothetical protein
LAAYRVYFSNSDKIHGREDFEAEHDAVAIRIARLLWDACADVCQSVELWQGHRRIPLPRASDRQPSLAELNEAHQRVVVETEEHIRQSEWLIANSRRLLESLDLAKAGLWRRANGQSGTDPRT